VEHVPEKTFPAETFSAPEKMSASRTFSEPAATPAKLMVHVEPSEAELLDNLWFDAKKSRPRLSKSDVMRVALILLNDHPEQLDSVLSRLHTSTESRQRASRKG
jgi:hypothetical protein